MTAVRISEARRSAVIDRRYRIETYAHRGVVMRFYFGAGFILKLRGVLREFPALQTSNEGVIIYEHGFIERFVRRGTEGSL
jgi:hypothetical protein